MLNYLKKFVLDILPSVFATIIGAYIVNHYIIPAATPKNPAAAVATVDPAVATSKADTPTEKESFAKGVAEKAAIEKTAEKAAEKSDSTPADSRKRHTPAPAKTAKAPPAAAPASVETVASVPASEERRDANDLARAAIERLRGTSEPSRTVATTVPQQQPAAVTPAPIVQPPVTNVVQPLPPAPEVFSVGTGAVPAATRPAPTPAPTRSAEASRPQPPASIPDGQPIELHADIEQPNRITTVADDVVSAAKSVFHAVIPR